jgi:protein arginine N-methyltransferase 1
MYSVVGFGSMIADQIRTNAYCEALRRKVKPGAVVLDIGTGTGVFALLACRFGAKKVYAIEPSDAIQVAREIAAANGCQDRIEFIQDLSTKITLPERADVIVSDLRGVLPLFGHHVPSIIDARERLLASGGVLIPQGDRLWAAVAEAPEVHQRQTSPWQRKPYGLDMTPALKIVTNTWCKCRVKPEQLLTEPREWAHLDYRSIAHPDVGATVRLTATRAGEAHGVLLWFDAELVDNIDYSNSPLSSELVYGSAFFPWPEPVSLDVGDVTSVTIKADLVGDDYVWSWDSCIERRNAFGFSKSQFQQSTFWGALLAAEHLHRRAAHFVPHLKGEGQIDRFVLGLIDGEQSTDQIAHRLAGQFPSRFASVKDALARVADLSQKYC